MGLASGEESCNCREQIGQWASWSLRIPNRHLNQDVDNGSQGGGDIEDVDVIVFPFRPPVSKVQELKGKECNHGAEDQQQRQCHLGGEHISACCISARMREEVALESTASGSPTPVRTSRRWPAKISRDIRRERQAQGHRETS